MKKFKIIFRLWRHYGGGPWSLKFRGGQFSWVFCISGTAHRRLIKLVSKYAEGLVSYHHIRECKALSALKKSYLKKTYFLPFFLIKIVIFSVFFHYKAGSKKQCIYCYDILEDKAFK